MNNNDFEDPDDQDDIVIPVGESCYKDEVGRTFYRSFSHNGQVVSLQDSVEISLSDEDWAGENLGYARIMAIFQDTEDLKIEVRWFNKPAEIHIRKRIFQSLPNDLFETDIVDEVPAGSFNRIMSLNYPDKGPDNAVITDSDHIAVPMTDEPHLSKSHFVCRYMYYNSSGNLSPANEAESLARDQTCSSYNDAYAPQGEILTETLNKDPFSVAICKMQLSVLPAQLPCRVTECESVQNYIRIAIEGCGNMRPLYISGLPGTGKTASVLTSIVALRKEMHAGTLGAFKFLEINCLRLLHPSDALAALWKFLSGESLHYSKALSRLEAHFRNAKRLAESNPDSKPVVTICLLDEVDFLLSKDDSVIFKFMSWPLMNHSAFVVICVANIMNLPERMSVRLRSRIGGLSEVDRLVYRPYTFDQMREILKQRLEDVSLELFEDRALEALELHRKAHARALKYGGTAPQITVDTVKEAVREHKMNPILVAIANCCLQDKIILVSMCKIGRTRTEGPMRVEAVYKFMRKTWKTFPADKPIFPKPRFSVFMKCLSSMIDRGILSYTDTLITAPVDFHMVMANISYSDIIAALGEHPLLQFA
eukprot:gene1076-2105_t